MPNFDWLFNQEPLLFQGLNCCRQQPQPVWILNISLNQSILIYEVLQDLITAWLLKHVGAQGVCLQNLVQTEPMWLELLQSLVPYKYPDPQFKPGLLHQLVLNALHLNSMVQEQFIHQSPCVVNMTNSILYSFPLLHIHQVISC